ncbi:MAG: hypothetical protein IPG72_05915 [Ardenticatenales bacterium]|nr:hypothetical protein [Ardenticatenales bacterium]
MDADALVDLDDGSNVARIVPRHPPPCAASAAIDLWSHGSQVTIRRSRASIQGMPQRGGGRRGDVTEFSAVSRRGLRRELSMIDIRHDAHIATLTYPANLAPSAAALKRSRRRLRERMRRQWQSRPHVAYCRLGFYKGWRAALPHCDVRHPD